MSNNNMNRIIYGKKMFFAQSGSQIKSSPLISWEDKLLGNWLLPRHRISAPFTIHKGCDKSLELQQGHV